MNKLNVKQIWSFINEDNDKIIFEESLKKTLKTKMLSKTEVSNIFIFNSKFKVPIHLKLLKKKYY